MNDGKTNQILVITNASQEVDPELGRRGALTPKIPSVTAVDAANLQSQVNIFLQQLNVVMTNTPEKVGDFKLAEFEVSAGIVVQGKGQIGIALLGQAELGGQINAGLRFVFKRS